MCQGWITAVGVVAIGLAGWLVVALVRALDEAETQLQSVLNAQRKLEAERDHLFDQVNRLQEARLERDLQRFEEGKGHP